MSEKVELKQCKCKYIFMETVRQHGERGSIGFGGGRSWIRKDRFYCEKCLNVVEKVKTETGVYPKPDWFD